MTDGIYKNTTTLFISNGKWFKILFLFKLSRSVSEKIEDIYCKQDTLLHFDENDFLYYSTFMAITYLWYFSMIDAI